MLKSFIKLAVFLFCSGASAQSCNWEWARGGGGEEFDNSQALSVDGFEHEYVSGRQYSLDAYYGSVHLIKNNPGCDIFIVQYDQDGLATWGKNFGNGGYNYSSGTASDRFGNVYLLGSFEDSVMDVGSVQLISKGSIDICLIKMQSNGVVLWAKTIGGEGFELPHEIHINSNDEILITGEFTSDSMYFDNSNLFVKNNRCNFFFAKYDLNGNYLLAHKFESYNLLYSLSVAEDDAHNFYLSGDYSDSLLVLDSDTLFNYYSLTTGFLDNSFLAKFDSLGNIMWSKNANGEFFDAQFGVAVDSNLNVYWGVNYYDNVGLDDTLFINQSYRGFLLVKFDSLGNRLRVLTPSLNYSAIGSSISFNPRSGIYFSGESSSFNLILGNITIPAGGLFFCKADADLNCNWAKRITANNTVVSSAISSNGNSDLYVAGYFRSSDLYFDTLHVDNYAFGSDNVYLAKIHESVVGMEDLDQINNIEIFPNPSSGLFHLHLTSPSTKLKVYDLVGQLVLEKEISNLSDVEFNIEGPGVFIVELSGNEYRDVARLIVTHK
ncbi:MAG TPA: T9SS type A sorting domain-containing protein [Bacteroidia bacterium]|nr:T9SS type A sorting domain-containing protein [Bacteroidota bacterium]MBK7571841.1 T9SS type A sorting domain-containing protein [Bacteroidota bacterium]MBP9120876.1 T9SS type A sorting domain-containing protein [Ignavibacterium sp.]HQV98684.1 T9SS type A sorting domain-containing protein [Bacteroidia bacterium]HQW21709.1 T9SS type A sorting domain-containing protein [Bacteroidia bacterium]